MKTALTFRWKLYAILIASLWAGNSIGQKISYAVGAGLLMRNAIVLSSLDLKPSNTLGFYNLAITRRSYLKASKVFFDAGLSYRYIAEDYVLTVAGQTNPNDGLLQEDRAHFLGVKIGLGRKVTFNNPKQYLTLPVVLTVHLPASAKRTSSSPFQSQEFKLFTGGNYRDGVYYDLYFRPTYHLKFSKTNRIPWSVGVFPIANLIFNSNIFFENPRFIYGGGFELRYHLDK